MSKIEVGSRVSVSSIPGSRGTVRFEGETSFSAGRWIGIELDAGGGKNDGSVAGQRYFACKPNHGVFAKPTGVKLLSTPGADSTPRARPSMAVGSARPSTVSRTPAVSSRPSVVSPPNTSSRPTSRLSASSSRPPSATPSSRAGAPPMSRINSASTDVSRRSSVLPASAARSPALLSPDPNMSPDSPGSPSPAQRSLMSPALPSVAERAKEADPFSLVSQKEPVAAAREATVSSREHEETLSKLRILERTRAEDRERLRDLERLKEEERNWKDVRSRLQSKMVEMQTELKTLRAQSKETAAERELHDSRVADLNDEIEMATLDKEVAEEKVDALEASVAVLKEKVAELETEASVLKSESAVMTTNDGGVAPPDHVQLVQLQRQNDRLKDALAKMREITAESEAESRKRIAELEKELDLTAEMQAEAENAVEHATLAEAMVEELKQQLDDAADAKDMAEDLTMRNERLIDQLTEKDSIIAMLEEDKELTDSLEYERQEDVKMLQEQLEIRESNLREQMRKCNELVEDVQDYEVKIGQFREYVLNLQSDLEQLRRQAASQQAESETLTSQSQAMLALNMKLQQSVSKSQTRTMDLELRRLDAMQASERLDIIKPYLPPSFFQGDSDAVDALLFFERLSAKADLISSGLAQQYNVAESLNTAISDAVVSVCETRGRLARFTVLTRRFTANLRRCPTEIFLSMGSVYREIGGIEKRIDIFVEAMRRSELKVVDCGKEVDKFIAQAAHLAEKHLGESGLDLGEQQAGVMLWTDLDLDTVVAGFGFAKQAVATLTKDATVTLDPADADLATLVFDPLQLLIDQSRTAQSLARKIQRRISDLVKRAAHLTPTTVEPMADVSRSLQKIAAVGVKMADLIGRYASDIRLTHGSLSVAILQAAIEEAAAELNLKSTNILAAIDTDLALAVSRLSAGLNAVLDSEQVVTLSHTSPWTERVAEIASAAAQTIDAEQRALRLTEELRDLRREMRAREQIMQESSVKIEVMDKRMEAVKKQADAMADLETELGKARKQENAYEETITALQAEIEVVNAELNKYKSGAIAAPTTGPALDTTETVAFTGSLETAHLVAQIESLRAAVRYIRHENAFLRAQPLALRPLPTASIAPEGLRELTAEHRALMQDTLRIASTPAMVDVRHAGKTFGWMPSSQKPEKQLEARRDAVRSLNNRLEVLRTRVQDMPRMTSIGA